MLFPPLGVGPRKRRSVISWGFEPLLTSGSPGWEGEQSQGEPLGLGGALAVWARLGADLWSLEVWECQVVTEGVRSSATPGGASLLSGRRDVI